MLIDYEIPVVLYLQLLHWMIMIGTFPETELYINKTSYSSAAYSKELARMCALGYTDNTSERSLLESGLWQSMN